ncbi:MAG TPA: hypothetical protein VI322_05200 [Candidatus Saccharimonadia bacterium]
MPPTRNQSNARLILFIIVAIVVVLIIALAVVLKSNSTNIAFNTPMPSLTPVATPLTNPSPSTLPKAPLQPTFTGFNLLTNHGLTQHQLNDVTFSLTKFARTLNNQPSSMIIAVVPGTVTPGDYGPDHSYDVLNFKIDASSNAQYLVSVKYFNVTSADTTVANLSGKAIYNSGTVDTYAGIGN